MGVLDNKERIIDTVVTDVGREALAKGEFEPMYVSFSDSAATYDNVTSSIKIYLEAPDSLPQDTISFTHTYRTGLNFLKPAVKVSGGGIYDETTVVTGSEFFVTASSILSSSFENFEKLQALRTEDIVFGNNDFEIDNSKVTFHLTDTSPIGLFDPKETKLSEVESLFQDKRLSHLPNFLYLPPINKKKEGQGIKPVGLYAKLNQPPLTAKALQGLLATKPKRVISFSETSSANNIICQIFDMQNNNVAKMDVVDFGYHSLDPGAASLAHIFFVGKLYPDEAGSMTFVNLFTVVFE